MRRVIAIALATVLMGCSDRSSSETPDNDAAVSQKYIGVVHGQMPAGVQRRGWIYLDSINGSDYALTAVAAGKQRMLWLDQNLKTDSAVVWKVIDALAFDSLTSHQRLQVGSCSSADVPAIEVVALTERETPTAAPAVKRAWRANRKAQKFTPLRPGGVVCK